MIAILAPLKDYHLAAVLYPGEPTFKDLATRPVVTERFAVDPIRIKGLGYQLSRYNVEFFIKSASFRMLSDLVRLIL
jgi:hypothetical protein